MTTNRLIALIKSCNVVGVIERGNNIMGCCPYHDERSPSWGISKRSPHLFGCFACHARGSLTRLLMDKRGLSRTKAEQLSEVKLAKESYDIVLSKEEQYKEQMELKLSEIEEILDMLVPSPIAYRYLMKRGIKLTTARQLNVRFDYEQNRVVFPWKVRGNLVGATGRTIDPHETAKMIPYGSMKKENWLYFPKPPVEGNSLVLVEGEIDSAKIMQATAQHPQYSVGALGFGTFTERQKSLALKMRPREVILAMDDDEAGREIAKVVNRRLRDFVKIKRVDWRPYRKLNGKTDPGELSDRKNLALVESASYDLWL